MLPLLSRQTIHKKNLPSLSKDSVKPPVKLRPNYFFDINNFEVVQNLNSGSFGTIKLVKNKTTGEKLAAKTNFIQTKTEDHDVISREVNILIRVQHPTIIKFRGVSYKDFDGNNNLTFLMDYMANGSLSDLLSSEAKSLCPKDYDNTKRQIILVGIAIGMMTLHNNFVIHRDLKPENILLDKDYHPCIADFGLSKFFDPQASIKQSISSCGTIAYMAPEVTQSYDFNTKADVYSFGILMYEVVTGSRAYDDMINQNKKITPFYLVQKISEGLRPEFKFPVKKGIKTMIEKCWSSNPDERPTFQEIFLKLSLHRGGAFDGFDNGLFQSVINEDDLDFCLDDVDTDELTCYIDEVMEGSSFINPEPQNNNKDDIIQKQEKIIAELKKENEDLKKQLNQLRTALNSKNTNPVLSQEQKFDKKTNIDTKSSIHVKPPSESKPNLNARINKSNSSSIQPFAKQQTYSINVSTSADIPPSKLAKLQTLQLSHYPSPTKNLPPKLTISPRINQIDLINTSDSDSDSDSEEKLFNEFQKKDSYSTQKVSTGSENKSEVSTIKMKIVQRTAVVDLNKHDDTQRDKMPDPDKPLKHSGFDSKSDSDPDVKLSSSSSSDDSIPDFSDDFDTD